MVKGALKRNVRRHCVFSLQNAAYAAEEALSALYTLIHHFESRKEHSLSIPDVKKLRTLQQIACFIESVRSGVEYL